LRNGKVLILWKSDKNNNPNNNSSSSNNNNKVRSHWGPAPGQKIDGLYSGPPYT